MWLQGGRAAPQPAAARAAGTEPPVHAEHPPWGRLPLMALMKGAGGKLDGLDHLSRETAKLRAGRGLCAHADAKNTRATARRRAGAALPRLMARSGPRLHCSASRGGFAPRGEHRLRQHTLPLFPGAAARAPPRGEHRLRQHTFSSRLVYDAGFEEKRKVGKQVCDRYSPRGAGRGIRSWLSAGPPV